MESTCGLTKFCLEGFSVCVFSCVFYVTQDSEYLNSMYRNVDICWNIYEEKTV